MKKKRYLFMALISMAMSSPSSVMAAYLINIRFGGPVAVSYSGIGAYTGSSSLGVNDTWNLIGAVQGDNVTGSQSNLALTTTTLSNAGFSYISDTVTNGGLKKTGFYPASQDALMASYVYAENGSMTITGLGAGTQFDLYVLSQPLKTGTNQGSNEMLTFNEIGRAHV